MFHLAKECRAWVHWQTISHSLVAGHALVRKRMCLLCIHHRWRTQPLTRPNWEGRLLDTIDPPHNLLWRMRACSSLQNRKSLAWKIQVSRVDCLHVLALHELLVCSWIRLLLLLPLLLLRDDVLKVQAKKSLIRDNWKGRCWLEVVSVFHWAVFLYLMIKQRCLHRQFTRSSLLELSPLRLRFQLLTSYHLKAMKDYLRASWPTADHMPLLIHQSSSYSWNGGGEALVCLQGGKARHHRNPLWLFLS